MKTFSKGILALIFVLGSLSNCLSQTTIRSYFVHVKGKVNIIHTYKGGPPPSDELLEKLSKPVPMSDAKLFLKKSYYGKTVYTIQTDSAGNFEMDIKPGVFNIYLSSANSSAKKSFDKKDTLSNCEEKYMTQSYGKLRIYRKSNFPLDITIRESINPCGPLPPAAPDQHN